VISTTSTVNNASCNGSNNGSINLNTVSGGTAPYTFAWSNGANTQNISGLAPGLYSVTITDANLCTGTFNFNITEPSLIAVTESLTHVTCNNGSNGAITLTSVTGGTAPYTFTWSNGATTQNISNVTANNYTVTVRDNNNCQQDFSFTINQPDAITTTASITDASCNGGNNGAIDITSVNGGTAPYSYDWSNGATTDDISGLTAGAYTLTVTDANNCTQNFVYNVDEPAALNPDATLSHVSCPGGNNGAITINSVSGGTAPHTFEWFDNSTANSVSGLTAGSYSVTITDAFNCFTVASFTINQPAPISVVADTDSSTCNGADNGAITLTQLNGGTAPYTFAWSNAETTQDISNLAPGAYSVTVSDANLCTASFNFDIFEPALIAVTEDLTQVTCNGGTDGAITLTSVTGGTAPFTFTWSNGATTQNISNVTANNYTVTVRDNNNCQQDFSFTINQPAAITTTASITDASCNGGNNGAIDITSVNGGTAPYSYAWSNGATTDDISGVTAGAYTLTVTDANNCTQDFIYNVGEPATLTPDATLSHVSCPGGNNGAITINSVSGGTAPHTFEWFDNSTGSSVNGLTAGSYSVTITDAFNCFTVASFTINQPAPISVVADTDSSTCNGADNGAITLTQLNGGTAPYTFAWSNAETTQDISNLAPGAYSVTVSDANLCTASFNFDIFEPAIIAVTEDLTHVTCNGGTDGAITLTSVTGGTAPYTFTWSNGATTQNISNVTANNYTVTVRDINNCQQDFSFIINQPDAVASNEVISNVSCMGTANGSISLNISGGTAPYSNFNWTNGETTQDISGLDAGSYGVTFEDASGCNYTFNFNVTEPGPLTGTASANPSNICPGNPVDITASFNATFTPGLNGYSFDGGITFQGGSVYNIPSVSSDTTVNVVLEDINGCRSSVIAVNISMKVFDAVINSTPVSCNGGNDGEAEISNISGGNAPYMYSFNGSPFGNSGTFTNLAAGTYTINVMDAQNCPSSYTVTVTQPDILVVSIDTLINVNPCAGANNGQVRLNATGGNVGYNYQMLSPAITNTTGIFTNLVPGTYNFEVTDSRGCFGTANATIIEPSPVDVQSINATIRRVTCAGYNNGRISLSNITGGVSPYTFNLNGRIKSVPVFDTLTAGNYNLTITDANGCPFTYSFNIPSPPPMVLNLQEVKGETCNNKDGEIILAGASGGTPSNFGYSFNINGGPFIPNQLVFSNLGSGTYTLGVIDSLQCYAGYTVVLSKKPGPIPYIRIERPLCRDEENGSIIVDSLQGGIPPFSFILNGNHMGNNTTFSGLGAGSYTMSVQDSTCIFAVTTYYLYNGVNYDTILTPPIIVTNPTDIDAQLIGVNSSGLSGSGMIWVYAVTGGAGKYEIGIDGVNYKPYNPADTTGNFLGNLTHGEYTVYIKDTNGCEITKTITINLNFFIPNLFTPNNDDSNDYFKILGLPSRSQLRVFNRWGSRVYENENYDNSWDGSGLPDGVYYYDLELPSGKVYKGWVEIMR
ncbi:MAG: gliding motility-associated C-terminal domain-containing protein, partial [Cytophagaceae bacterium]